ncbi:MULTISPECIES: hypothetical protein [unclassified Leptolyngbya]|uniref:tetratricopeptide repeat protein n=1 Tax=unclassified Leptolyngbya TaxID=2650499 RepID=UPI001683D7BD|nr:MULTISPECIES: hypothetical protein [unclassified Leptolyngbya]MBD1909845.1 hypothetical protein [Leptolyngbya sp. FACHB-8]MBD2156941.1 hypothetical protein [Leptolyngbya sp. FACHB-16]
MSSFKPHKVLWKISTILCVSSAIATSSALQPVLAAVLVAQSVQNAAPTCQTERQQSEEALLNMGLEQAEQAITNGRIEYGSQLLVMILQRIRVMPNGSARIGLLERLVGSLGENVAYSSPLDRLMQSVSPQQPQAAIAVLSAAFDVAQTISPSYSASKTRTLTALANDYTQVGQPDQSVNILGQAMIASNTIQGAELKAIALNGIAEAYKNAGQSDLAARTLERSLPLAQSINDPNPYRRAAVLERIASIYEQIDMPDRALSIAQSIPVPGYTATVMVAVAEQYREKGQVGRALEVLQSLPTQDRVIPLAAFAGHLTAQQPQQADEIYGQAVSETRSLGTADTALVAVARRYGEAGGLIAKADETVQTIADPAVQAPGLGAIALLYAQAGEENRAETRLGQAIEKLGTIPDVNAQNSARQQLMDQVAERGRYDYGVRIAQTIQAGEEIPFDRVDVLTALGERAIADQRYDAALQITKQIPPSFASWRDNLFSKTARGLAHQGDIDAALPIAQEANVDLGFQPRILAIIAAESKLLGQSEQSTTLFNQAIAQAASIDDASTQTAVFGAIAQAYLTSGQEEQAIQMLDQAIAAAQTIEDSTSHTYALRTLAEQLAFNKQPRAALRVAEAIPEPSERLAKINEAIEKAIQMGDFPTVETGITRLNDPALQSFWFISLSDRYRLMDDRPQAATLLNQAFQVARTVPGDESQTVMIRGGEAPLSMEDDRDRGSLLGAIALRYAQLGQMSQARQVIQTLQDARLRQSLLQQVNCYR